MLNSLFRKWLAALLAITLTMLLVLSLTLSWLVQRDFYRQGLNQLDEQTETVKQTYERYAQGSLTAAAFRKALKGIEKDQEISVSILGKKVKYLQQDLYAVGVRPDIKSWVVSVSEGARVEKIAKFRRQDDAKVLVVGFPLYKNGEIVASAFVYAPVANMNELAAPIRRSIWLVALAAAGPLLLLLWFAARRFANPIRKLDKAARAVAGGDFTLRVDARGQDELARLGMSFNTMAERIERIEEQRRRLIAEIAHELRTPLTSIRATLQAFSDGILSPREQREFAEVGLEESLRLGKLIDNIHELSAFEEHRIQFEFKLTDLTALAGQTVTQFKHEAETLGIALRFEASADTPITVSADARRIRQVLINLIGNALEHNERGTRVNVRLTRDARFVRFTVEDNGAGIAPEHLPHLFERLYKAESSRSTKGFGLGLTISRHIVQAHGGTITAASEPGKGTEFRVALPTDRA